MGDSIYYAPSLLLVLAFVNGLLLIFAPSHLYDHSTVFNPCYQPSFICTTAKLALTSSGAELRSSVFDRLQFCSATRSCNITSFEFNYSIFFNGFQYLLFSLEDYFRRLPVDFNLEFHFHSPNSVKDHNF